MKLNYETAQMMLIYVLYEHRYSKYTCSVTSISDEFGTKSDNEVKDDIE